MLGRDPRVARSPEGTAADALGEAIREPMFSLSVDGEHYRTQTSVVRRARTGSRPPEVCLERLPRIQIEANCPGHVRCGSQVERDQSSPFTGTAISSRNTSPRIHRPGICFSLSALRMERHHTGGKFDGKEGQDSKLPKLGQAVSSKARYSLRPQQTTEPSRLRRRKSR